MGYEVVFHYHEQQDEGYNTTETKMMKKVLGCAEDDFTEENLAKYLMKELARRDILHNKFEVYEFTKKKISCKINKDGILIKNKRISFDLTTTELPTESNSTQAIPVTPPIVPKINLKPPKTEAIRFEVFDPHPDLLASAKKMNFTIGKKYPIFEEKFDTRGERFGMQYITEDDGGNRRTMSDRLFTPHIAGLTRDMPNDAKLNSEKVQTVGDEFGMKAVYTFGR